VIPIVFAVVGDPIRLALVASQPAKRQSHGDAPDFVEVGEAGMAMDDAMRRQRRVQLVG
jgi:hypothetical protein